MRKKVLLEQMLNVSFGINVKHDLSTWYVRHCEAFIRRNKETRLKQHTTESVFSYLAVDSSAVNSAKTHVFHDFKALLL